MYGGGRVRRVLMTPRGKCSDRGSTPRASTKTLVLLYLYIGVFVAECLAGVYIIYIR